MVWPIIMFAMFPLILHYLNPKLTGLLVYGADNLPSVGGDHKKSEANADFTGQN